VKARLSPVSPRSRGVFPLCRVAEAVGDTHGMQVDIPPDLQPLIKNGFRAANTPAPRRSSGALFFWRR
jgi:hypothetical protein